jgi:hypothetical protein
MQKKNRRLLLESDSYGYWAWWSRFSTGFEALVKSVFLSNKISLIEKNNYLEKGKSGSKILATPEAARVYDFIKGSEILVSNNEWLRVDFTRLDISCSYEINSGTLGKYRNKLGSLERLNKISSEEHIFAKDSIIVLSDIRRNVDAHIFFKSQVGGEINGDLSSLHIPSINILLRAYQA